MSEVTWAPQLVDLSNKFLLKGPSPPRESASAFPGFLCKRTKVEVESADNARDLLSAVNTSEPNETAQTPLLPQPNHRLVRYTSIYIFIHKPGLLLRPSRPRAASNTADDSWLDECDLSEQGR